MARATMELDFFGIEKENSAAKLQRSSIREIQSAISRNPKLLRSVMASGFLSGLPAPSIPILNSASSSGSAIPSSPGTAPLTIFFNGTVSVFNVSHDKAESIIRKAGEVSVKDRFGLENGLPSRLTGDLPIARKMSLQRFLARRKQRLSSVGPYEKEFEVASVKKENLDVTQP
ncbi:protein TIFY 9 [Typha latifolia]|uniref:protein TIFY 9 n=1 Tax=Typha latifolia TaxID=4733 RepID=UPI003C30985B